MAKIHEHLVNAMCESPSEVRFGGIMKLYRAYPGFYPEATLSEIREALQELVESGDILLRKVPPKTIGFMMKFYSVRSELVKHVGLRTFRNTQEHLKGEFCENQ